MFRGLQAVLVGLVLALVLCCAPACSTLLDTYPNAHKRADLAGTWVHGPGELVLNADGTFEMTDMPKWVVDGDSSLSKSGQSVSCTGTWTFQKETQNLDLTGTGSSCSSGLIATGRAGEITITFGIDDGSGDPRCYELVRAGSRLKPQGIDECLQYN